MKDWPKVKLGDVAEQCLGKMLDAKKNKGRLMPYLRNPNVRWFDVDTSDLKLMPFEDHEQERYGLQAGDIVICEGGEAGRAAIWDGRLPDLKFQKAIHRIRPGRRLHNRYFVHRLMADHQAGRLADYLTGATIKHLTGQDLARYAFALPPLAEQQKIAEVLDRTEALRAKRRLAIVKLDVLTRSLFLDLFGDPASNPKHWPEKTIGELASKFSDGPFGSNLKSSHYNERGVRVVRLQNIGAGEFVDRDKAYISESHFESLKKHECRAGDILIGTLGEPNLRACIQPEWLPLALNKADCVQLRPNMRVANSEFICTLLNLPATERMAQELMRGQTRVRISMGRLRGLAVPVPPIEMQHEFARQVAAVKNLKKVQGASLAKLDELFVALQHRSFRREL